MIQQIVTTITGFILGLTFNKITKNFKKPPKSAYPEIEITDYHYSDNQFTDIWEL